MEVSMNLWIKIDVNTPDKPEIRAAARLCDISIPEAFLAFFKLWAYFDQHTATGFIPALNLADLDDLSGVKGFGRAMQHVGWLDEDTRGIAVSNWDRHNGESAKKRALALQRVQKHRAAKQWKKPM
jgi:DNA replication protein DnaT